MTDEHAEPETIEGSTTTALAEIPVEERNLRGLELADSMFPQKQRDQIAALLTIPANSPALMPYLALCVGEGFSPWANHVWLIPKKVKVPSEDGNAEVEVTKHIPMVGRDGLLHKARQSKGRAGGFRGLKFGVVCERDTFEVFEDGSFDGPAVMHRYASKPTQFDEGVAPDRYRGRIIGAWAKCFVEGEPPTFYFASLREHGRLRHVWEWNDAVKGRRPLYHAPGGGVTFDAMAQVDNGASAKITVQNRPVEEWEGAWDYLSTMILKAAQSYVLRIALGVTGFVPADELRSVEEWQNEPLRVENVHESMAVADFDFDTLAVSEELRERLRVAIDAANAADPFSWAPAKCDMVLSGRPESDLEAIAGQIEEENSIRAARAEKVEQARAEREEADAAAEAQRVERAAEAEAHPELPELLRRRDELVGQVEAAEDPDVKAGLRARLDQVEMQIRAIRGE